MATFFVNVGPSRSDGKTEDNVMEQDVQIDEGKVEDVAQKIFELCQNEEMTVMEVFITLNLAMETLVRGHQETFASMGIYLPEEYAEMEDTKPDE